MSDNVKHILVVAAITLAVIYIANNVSAVKAVIPAPPA